MSPLQLLKLSLPKSWVGLVTALSSSSDQLLHMERWLSVSKVRCQETQSWTELLTSLTQCKPLICNSGDKLCFLPVLLHLPGTWQCYILTFIYQHQKAITQRDFNSFVAALTPYLEGRDKTDPDVNSPSSPAHDLPCSSANIITDDSDDGMAFPSKDEDQTKTVWHLGMGNDYSWTKFWIYKLKSRFHFLRCDETKTKNSKKSGFQFSAEHLDWINNTVSINSHGYQNAWSYSAKTVVQHNLADTETVVSKGSYDSQNEQGLSDQSSVPEIDTANLTPAKKCKLDSTFNEDLSLLSQAVPDLQEEQLVDLHNLKESWHAGCVPTRQEDVNLLTQCPHDMIDNLCKALELSSLPETSLVSVAMEISSFKGMLPLSHATALAKHCLLEKMLSLDSVASRYLCQACVSLTEAYPSEVIHSVLTPVLLHPEISNHHCDVIIKLLKDTLQADYQLELIRSFLEKQNRLHASVIQVLQFIADTKMDIDENILGHLITIIVNSCHDHVDSLKFGKLMLAVVKQYGKQLSNKQAMELEQAATSHGTFLKKSIISALKKVNKI